MRRLGNSHQARSVLGFRPAFAVSLAQEVRHAMRRLIRDRAFSAPAVITLSLGIGATVAAFAVLESVVLRPLSYEDPDRLMRIQTRVPALDPETRWGLAKGEFLYFQKETASFAALGLYQLSRVTLEPDGDGFARSVEVAQVSRGLFSTLSVRPVLGRLPDDADSLASEPLVAWLSHDLWLERFGGDREVVGRLIPVDGRSLEVAGVLGPDARLPEESVVSEIDVGLWVPLWLDPGQPPATSHVFRALGRLDPGIPIEAAAAELEGLTKNLPFALPEAYSDEYLERTGMATEVVPLREDVLGGTIVRSLWILFASVLVVLGIAWVNVTNLFLARVETSRRETGMRAALGAGRERLLAGFFTESFAVAGVAGGFGLVLAHAAMRVLRIEAPADLPRLEAIRLDAPALAVALALVLLTGSFFGLLPGLRRYGIEEIRGSGGLRSVSRRGRLVRQVLVGAQIALSLLLLVGGTLLYRSFQGLKNVDPGFEPRRVLTFSVVLPAGRYDSYELVATAYRTLARGLEEAAGIERAAVAMTLPMTGFDGCTAVLADGQPPGDPEEVPCVPIYLVSPGYFEAMGIEVHGRAPDWADAERRLPLAVVSRSLAERLWPGRDPMGRGITLSKELDPFRVVGVAADVRADGLDQPVTSALYLPMTPPPGPELWPPLTLVTLIARTEVDRPAELVPTVRRVLSEIDPLIPLRDVRPLSEVVARSMNRLSFFTLLLAAASAVAFVLSAVGIYGVVSFLVERRRTELGVRMALGARRGAVQRMVVGESLVLAICGVVAGIGAALAVMKMLESLLYGVSARDPWTIGLVSAFLLTMAAVASWAPALRASRIPPADVLRQE